MPYAGMAVAGFTIGSLVLLEEREPDHIGDGRSQVSIDLPRHFIAVKERNMAVMLIAVGHPGSDAPGAIFINGHWVPTPGWQPLQMEIMRSALAIANEAVGIKDATLQKHAFETSAAMLKTQAEYLAKVGTDRN